MPDRLLITDAMLNISDVNQNALTALPNLVVVCIYEYWIVVAVTADKKVAIVVKLMYLETSSFSDFLTRGNANSSKYKISEKIYGIRKLFVIYLFVQRI